MYRRVWNIFPKKKKLVFGVHLRKDRKIIKVTSLILIANKEKGRIVSKIAAAVQVYSFIPHYNRKFKSCKFHASTVDVFSSQNLPFELPQSFIS